MNLSTLQASPFAFLQTTV